MTKKHLNLQYFEQAGLRNLSKKEEASVSSQFRREMLVGLAGKPSSVAMYPTLLSPIKLNSLKDGSALVVEIGGSHIYGAIVVINKGKAKIKKSTKSSLKRRKFPSAQVFFLEVINGLKPILKNVAPDALGIVYSQYGKAVSSGRHVDVLFSGNLTKEIVVPGIGGQAVGKSFREILHEKYGLDGNVPTVVLNDTVAVLLSIGAKVGGVVGTGFNLAIMTKKGVVNSESGGFAIKQTHRFAQEVDKHSVDVGKQLTEKQISGKYLGWQLELIIRELGLESFIDPEFVTSETISEILSHQKEYKETPLLLDAVKRLRDRSAQLVGIIVGTVIDTFGDVINEDIVDVPIEGSLFWGMPGYADEACNVSERISNRKVHFLDVPNAGRIGAAVAALGQAQLD